MVGAEVEFCFSSEWKLLSKTAVFIAGDIKRVVMEADWHDNICTVPSDCLAVPDVHLMIGIYGANGEGNIVIPTIYADIGLIWTGAAPDFAAVPEIPKRKSFKATVTAASASGGFTAEPNFTYAELSAAIAAAKAFSVVDISVVFPIGVSQEFEGQSSVFHLASHWDGCAIYLGELVNINGRSVCSYQLIIEQDSSVTLESADYAPFGSEVFLVKGATA